MQFSTSLVLFVAIVTGALRVHTMPVFAVPHGGREPSSANPDFSEESQSADKHKFPVLTATGLEARHREMNLYGQFNAADQHHQTCHKAYICNDAPATVLYPRVNMPGSIAEFLHNKLMEAKAPSAPSEPSRVSDFERLSTPQPEQPLTEPASEPKVPLRRLPQLPGRQQQRPLRRLPQPSSQLPRPLPKPPQ
ncbi:hypothetical protein BC835DRAFT_1524543 [Cytidiella melzeri]|nr:hypothetical protein BC835DRAFT_1524543 [Cytidiella melzeri]